MANITTKEFKEGNKDFCNKYNEMLDLYYRCGEYLETPGRTEKELAKFVKMEVLYTNKLSLMMQEYKELTGNELSNRIVLGGFLLYQVK